MHQQRRVRSRPFFQGRSNKLADRPNYCELYVAAIEAQADEPCKVSCGSKSHPWRLGKSLTLLTALLLEGLSPCRVGFVAWHERPVTSRRLGVLGRCSRHRRRNVRYAVSRLHLHWFGAFPRHRPSSDDKGGTDITPDCLRWDCPAFSQNSIAKHTMLSSWLTFPPAIKYSLDLWPPHPPKRKRLLSASPCDRSHGLQTAACRSV